MNELSREFVAYTLIGMILLIGTVLISIAVRRRRRALLRRRGIKRYGH